MYISYKVLFYNTDILYICFYYEKHWKLDWIHRHVCTVKLQHKNYYNVCTQNEFNAARDDSPANRDDLRRNALFFSTSL